MIFDTHAHYDDESFDEDREELLFSLKNKGVGTVVNVGASVASTKKTFEIVKKYDFMYGAVGIHPEDVERLDESHMEWLKSLAADKKIVAIEDLIIPMTSRNGKFKRNGLQDSLTLPMNLICRLLFTAGMRQQIHSI